MKYVLIFIIICAVITSFILFLRLLQIIFLFLHRKKQPQVKIVPDRDLLRVSIMIPAYNEEKVIKKTLNTILNLDYPQEKIEVILVNPGSKDDTAKIAREIAAQSKIKIKVVEPANGFECHGKPRALNFGLKHTTGDIIIVYDADSLVDKMAVKYLASYLIIHPNIAMAFGMRRAVNPHSFFARLGYLESLSQQLSIEAVPPREGQKLLFSPGTNVAIWKSVLEKLGGWDDNALTEDFELSARLHFRGYKIGYVYFALSWEEVAEKLNVWLGQRVRWVRGGNHVFFKTLKEIRKTLKKRKLKFLSFIILLKVIEFYAPLLALVLTDALFILGMLEIFVWGGVGVGFFLWILFYALVFFHTMACLVYAREISFKNILGALSMYFYFQLWLVVFVKVFWLDLVHAPNLWEKTERFASHE